MNGSNESQTFPSLVEPPGPYIRNILISFSVSYLLTNGLCLVLAYLPIVRAFPKVKWNSIFKWFAINYSIVGLVLFLDSILILVADLMLLVGTDTTNTTVCTTGLCTFHFSLVSTVIPTVVVCIPSSFVLIKTFSIHRNVAYKRRWIAYAIFSIASWIVSIILGIPFLVPDLFPSTAPSFGHICSSNESKGSVIRQVKILYHVLPFTISTLCLYSISHALLRVHRSHEKRNEEYAELKVLIAAIVIHHLHTTVSGIGGTTVSSIFRRDGFSWKVLIIVQLSIEASKLLFPLFSLIMIFLYKDFYKSAKQLYCCKGKHQHSRTAISPH